MSFQEQLIAFLTIVRKEVKRFMRIWTQTLVPPVITITLYFIIFGNLIGSRIGPMGGVGYMEFVVPGLIMMSVITSSYTNVVSSFFGAKFQRFVEEMLVSPTPNYIILLGFVIDSLWLEDSPVRTESPRWFFRGNSFQFWDCFILRGSTAEEVIGKLETLADHDPASLLAHL